MAIGVVTAIAGLVQTLTGAYITAISLTTRRTVVARSYYLVIFHDDCAIPALEAGASL